MVTASLVSTILAISLPPALLLLLAKRSKKRLDDNFPQRQQQRSITSHMRCRRLPSIYGHDPRRGPACRCPSVIMAGLASALLTAQASAAVVIPACGMLAEMTMTFRGPAETTMVAVQRERVGTRRKSYLPGKVVWITGASSGLGEQLAISAAAGGAEGLILSGRREDALDRVKKTCEEEIAALGGGGVAAAAARVRVLPFDVADFDFVEKEAAPRALECFGRVDALVLNAGISTRGSIEETSLDVDRRVMAVNYFGPVGLAKGLLLEASRRSPPQQSQPSPTSTAATSGTAAEDVAVANSSSIVGVDGSGVGTPEESSHPRGILFVVINSVQGKFGMGFRSSYAASKHALVGFFDCLRAEHSGRGLGVLSVFPGYVRTSLSVNALTADGTKHAQMDATTAQGRDPREVADEIWRAAAEGKDEVVIADLKTKVAVLLRALAPRTLFRIMGKRARKAGAAGGQREEGKDG